MGIGNEFHWDELNRMPPENRGPWFDGATRWRVGNQANWMDAEQERELVRGVTAYLRDEAAEQSRLERRQAARGIERSGDPGE
jgi:hypothetical protein